MAYTIAEVADLVGVPPSTLRYYEAQRVVRQPARAENGYRAYEERDVARLRFVARAKQLNLNVPALRELVEAWDSDDCSTVQHRMVDVVASRLAETQGQIAELIGLAGALQETATRLRGTPESGPCSDSCACTSTAALASEVPAERFAGVMLLPMVEPAGVAIACTLEPGAVRGRVEDWQAILAKATERVAIDGGVALRFPADADVAADLGRLAVAEQGCCSFFDFRMHIDSGTLTFEVRTPPEAAPITASLFGVPIG